MRYQRRSARRRQRGVSLLESIAVVALSGTVSAVTMPYLTELSTEARVHVVGTLEGALRSASTLVHLKCAVTPACALDTGGSTVQAFGMPLRLVRGYPAVDAAGGIDATLDFPGFSARQLGREMAFQKNDAPDAERCAVVYREPERDGGTPLIEAVTSGC